MGTEKLPLYVNGEDLVPNILGQLLLAGRVYKKTGNINAGIVYDIKRSFFGPTFPHLCILVSWVFCRALQEMFLMTGFPETQTGAL